MRPGHVDESSLHTDTRNSTNNNRKDTCGPWHDKVSKNRSDSFDCSS